MLLAQSYFICFAVMPLVSEFPLHILQFVDDRNAEEPMEHNVPQPSQQSTQTSIPFHAKSTLQVASSAKTLEHQDPGNPPTSAITDNSKHIVYACMLIPFAILQAYMLWQTIAYTYSIHLNDREPLFSRVFIWTLTTVSFCRYTYSICACVTMYLYVFYPQWLPCGTTLRKRNWNAYCFVLSWAVAAICAPFILVFNLGKEFLYLPLIHPVECLQSQDSTPLRDGAAGV
jgi:hypothetical protein